MEKLQIDDVLLAKIRSMQATVVQITDSTGKIVGMFYPAPEGSTPKYWEPEFTEEELERRRNEKKTYSTAEVLAYLEKL